MHKCTENNNNKYVSYERKKNFLRQTYNAAWLVKECDNIVSAEIIIYLTVNSLYIKVSHQ